MRCFGKMPSITMSAAHCTSRASRGGWWDLAGFDGRVRWQGRGADPTRGRGHRLSDLITRWRQRSTATVVVAYVPKTKLAEVTTWLEQAGCPLSTAVATEVDPRAA